MEVNAHTEGLTPMMRQYFLIKEKHRDHIVFFRLGDFYEMFFDDALFASKQLGLTLTGRDCGLNERAPMCGIPYHSCDSYIAKLIKGGCKVAICEQVEDPVFAKGVVSREVVRVITPGTVLEDHLLQEDANNFLCSIYYDLQGFGLAFADISTGEVNLIQIDSEQDMLLINELARYAPKEVIFNKVFLEKKQVAKYMRDKLCCTADLIEDEPFEREAAGQAILAHFQRESLEEMGLEEKPRCIRALGGLLAYLKETQIDGTERLMSINLLEESRFMNLDLGTRANLELLENVRTGEKRGSLLWVLDDTKTAMGKRLIRSYISQPLINPLEVEKRLNAVEELCRNELLEADITAELGGVFDMERLITRVVYGSATPREYKTLEAAIARLPAIKVVLRDVKSNYLTQILKEIDPLDDVREMISRAIVDEPPNSPKDGGVIRPGFHEELDHLRDLMGNSRQILSDLEAREREKTGIKNLKISFNKVFGYYFEVTKSYLNMVPDYYIRKQTLANCERYIIEELKDLENRILSAQDTAVSIEQQLFQKVRAETARQLHRIQLTASAIARLDVFTSFARVSRTNRYVRPVIDISDTIHIQNGRHPVVEQLLGAGAPFVPNDALLDVGENQICIITGPNMAGKSTYMRQTALLVLMAQIGCFVPAESARVGVVDGIFTRIGASDDLSTGQSTFMVEMVEVAQILQGATSKSLLILDEIGRGTSTYDGMSIARAVLEYIAGPKKVGAKTMFATHYHELTEMENELDVVKNYNIACKKRGEELTFLRKIVRGGADESYGIEVSKLAGIPDWIVKRARAILEDLENNRPVKVGKKRFKVQKEPEEDLQISLAGTQPSEVEQQLRDIDLNTFTPIEALTLLYQIKEKVSKKL